MSCTPYALSFTGGALLHNSSLIVAQQYLENKDWQRVKEQVIEQNLLQARTQSTLKRIYLEISKRLQVLSDSEIETLLNVTHQEQAYILWLAICRHYKYIGDFAAEVLRDNFVTFKTRVTEEDYQTFYLRKSDDHPELISLTDSTQGKMKQVLFKMMKEARLLNDNNNILTMLLTPKLADILAASHLAEARYFPVLDSNLHGQIQ